VGGTRQSSTSKNAEALDFQEYAMDEFIAGENSVVELGHE
jgi:hypothetical protein